MVLNALAAIAALDVQHTAVRPLLVRRLKDPVDKKRIAALGAADEHWHSSRVVRGDSSRLSGGTLSALRKNKTASHKTRKKGRWQGGDGGGRGEVAVGEGAHAGGRAGSRL